MLRTHGVVLATLIIARCGDPATAPTPVPSVHLELRIASGDVVEAFASAHNAQAQPIYYAAGCGAEDGIWFDVIGPDGRAVSVTPPGVRPACATAMAMLAPRARLESSLRFDGTLYDRLGQPYAAPAGRYFVIARFRWWPTPAATESVVLEEREAFLWD